VADWPGERGGDPWVARHATSSGRPAHRFPGPTGRFAIMPAAMETIADATTATFDAEALQSEAPVVLVDFWAPWCAPCRALTPALEALAAERDDLKLVKVNTDEEQTLAASYGVMGLPTVVILREGRPVGTITQAAPKRRLAAQIDAAIEG
jgi:thioredoxin 1